MRKGCCVKLQPLVGLNGFRCRIRETKQNTGFPYFALPDGVRVYSER